MSGLQTKIEITGPEGSAVSRTASKLADTLRLDGKVVRLYDLTKPKSALPDPLPLDCHFIIIVRNA